MSTHNIGFYEDLTKLLFNYNQISSNTQFISSSVNTINFVFICFTRNKNGIFGR